MEQPRKSIASGVVKSVHEALLSILKEEKRRKINDYGHDELDTNRLYKISVERLFSGKLCTCENCGGIISMKRALLNDGPFTITCSDTCSYELVLRKLYEKIHTIESGLCEKRAFAGKDMISNERPGSNVADAFICQDINIQILQNSQRYLKKLYERKDHLEKNPGDFQICSRCEEEIPLDRLIASPETGLCRACKKNTRDTATNGRSTIFIKNSR